METKGFRLACAVSSFSGSCGHGWLPGATVAIRRLSSLSKRSSLKSQSVSWSVLERLCRTAEQQVAGVLLVAGAFERLMRHPDTSIRFNGAGSTDTYTSTAARVGDVVSMHLATDGICNE